MPFKVVSAEDRAAKQKLAQEKLAETEFEFGEFIGEPEVNAKLAELEVEVQGGGKEPLLTKLQRDFAEADPSGKKLVLMRALKFYTRPDAAEARLVRRMEKMLDRGNVLPPEIKAVVEPWLNDLENGGEPTLKKAAIDRLYELDDRKQNGS